MAVESVEMRCLVHVFGGTLFGLRVSSDGASERGEMTRAAMIVSYQPLRLFHAKGCLLLCLHSPLVIPADFRSLHIILLFFFFFLA